MLEFHPFGKQITIFSHSYGIFSNDSYIENKNKINFFPLTFLHHVCSRFIVSDEAALLRIELESAVWKIDIWDVAHFPKSTERVNFSSSYSRITLLFICKDNWAGNVDTSGVSGNVFGENFIPEFLWNLNETWGNFLKFCERNFRNLQEIHETHFPKALADFDKGNNGYKW